MARAVLTFETVYRTHFRLVWRTLGRFGVRDADLMDATQNVFIVVHRQLDAFRGTASLTTWLFAICRNIASDYRRSACVRLEVLVDADEVATREAQPQTQLEHVASQAVLRSLDAILKQLPKKIRAVFELYALQEMTGDEIASFLEIPLGTVRSRLRLAKMRIGNDVARSLGISEGQ
jgi:RNA polymerase sigma-70 factor (ECF subfamily)